MAESEHDHLSRRERQILDILYELKEATAAEIRHRLPDPPSYSAARAMLAKLEAKGQVHHRQDGPRYVYAPSLPRSEARRAAVSRLVKTFFDGSTTEAICGILGMSAERMSQEELDLLSQRIEQARKEGR